LTKNVLLLLGEWNIYTNFSLKNLEQWL